MYTGSLPPASIYSTWRENAEVLSADDEAPYDLTLMAEIAVQVIDPPSHNVELNLTKSDGSVTVPAPGIIEWRAEAEAMGTLIPKLYKVLILLFDGTDTITLVLGTLSVVE